MVKIIDISNNYHAKYIIVDNWNVDVWTPNLPYYAVRDMIDKPQIYWIRCETENNERYIVVGCGNYTVAKDKLKWMRYIERN